MTENITLYERNGLTGETVETVLTGAEADAWRAALQPSNEEFLQNLRNRRNRLLSETDYLALSDSTLTDEMRTYRQALRDLPANTADPANPVWPVKPGGDS